MAPAKSMLMLHGLGNSAAVWKGFVAATRAGYQVTTADLPWSGDRIGQYAGSGDPDRWVDEALEQCGGQVDVVVAHSYAAVLLLIRLGRHPELMQRFGIRGVVFVSPFYRASREQFNWGDIEMSITGFSRIMSDGIKVHTGNRLTVEHCDELAERVRDRVGPYGWADFYNSYLATPFIPVHKIELPCLVVSGVDDFAAPAAEAETLADRLPRGRYRRLERCGHFLMSERPDAFTAQLDEFTTTLTNGAHQQ